MNVDHKSHYASPANQSGSRDKKRRKNKKSEQEHDKKKKGGERTPWGKGPIAGFNCPHRPSETWVDSEETSVTSRIPTGTRSLRTSSTYAVLAMLSREVVRGINKYTVMTRSDTIFLLRGSLDSRRIPWHSCRRICRREGIRTS